MKSYRLFSILAAMLIFALAQLPTFALQTSGQENPPPFIVQPGLSVPDDVETRMSRHMEKVREKERRRIRRQRQDSSGMVAAQAVPEDSSCHPLIRQHILRDFNEGRPADLQTLISRMARFDWREYSVVTPVKDQNRDNCSQGCWAYAAVAAFESSFLFTSGLFDTFANLDIPADLARPHPPMVKGDERRVLTCVAVTRRNRTNNCTSGGWHGDAFDTIFDKGLQIVHPAFSRPKPNLNCNMNEGRKIEKWGYIGFTERRIRPRVVPTPDEIKSHLIRFGPIVAGIVMDQPFQEFKGARAREANGLFKGAPTMNDSNHIVLIVGWDDAKDAWIIKNSWGARWGIDGFAFVKRNANRIGQFATFVEIEPEGGGA